MAALNRDSPIPYYHQLKSILIEQIMAADEVHEPLPLPTEKELQEKFQVSRSVVRQAISELVQDGYVVRQQGRGTFALPHKLRHNPQPEKARSLGLSGYLKERGIASRTSLISREITTASARVALSLNLLDDKRVLHFERLRLAGETAIGIQRVYVPVRVLASLPNELADEDLLYGASSMDYLRERLGVVIGKSARTIEATALDRETAELLHSEVGQPALQVRRVVYAVSGEAVEFFDAIYRGDEFEYSLEFDHA